MHVSLKNLLKIFFLLTLLTNIKQTHCMIPAQLNPYWQDNPTDISRWIITQEEILTTTPIRGNNTIIGLSFNVANMSDDESIRFTLSIKMGTVSTTNPTLLCSKELPLQTVLNKNFCIISPDGTNEYILIELLFDIPFVWDGLSNLVIETHCTDVSHTADILIAEHINTTHIATYGTYGDRPYLLNKRPKIGLIVNHDC